MIDIVQNAGIKIVDHLSPRINIMTINCSGGESKGSRVVEFIWPTKDKSSAHSHLHSV
jgi:two-component SAPR family response regulator